MEKAAADIKTAMDSYLDMKGKNMMQDKIKIGIKDCNNKDIFLGDILYNPVANDYWVVHKDQDDCEFWLYNDDNLYACPADEPSGFMIVIHPWDKKYEEAINSLKDYAADFYKDLDDDADSFEIEED